MKNIALLLLGTLLMVSQARAVDSLAARLGQAEDANLAGLDATWQWDRQWFAEGHWHLTGYWEGGLAYWDGQGAGAKSVWELGFAPILRLRPNASGGTQPYLDAGIGAHLFSGGKLNATRELDSGLRIAQQVGLGVTFGAKSRYDISYRVGYLPSDDITSHQVRLSCLF
jgi:hypothetical protein